jgi:excisionase family DNA binding protein
MTKRYYTTDEVAAICRVTVWTVREWIKADILKGTKRGRAYLIAEEDLKTYLEAKHG